MSSYVIMILTGALIGWATNYIAIKSLFRPSAPITIGFIRFHGLLPKRRAELAASIARIVENELVTTEALSQRLQAENVKQRITHEIMVQVEIVLVQKLPRMLQQVGVDLILPIVKREIDNSLDGWLDRAQEFIRDEAKVGEMVKDRINGFDLAQLEKLVMDVAGTELKHIELLGGFLGGLIGLIQALLIQFI